MMHRHSHIAVRELGFSLVEVMIGLTIGLIIMASLSVLLADNTSARAELDKSMQQIENGRYATELLKDELRLAGYYGPSYSPGNTPAVLPDPCATDVASLKSALPLAVQGYSQITAATNPLTCLSSANLTSTANDILVVRRAKTGPLLTVAAVATNTTTVYMQANGDDIKLDVGGSSGFTLTDKNGTATLRPYSVQIYFVSPCDVPAGNATSCTGATDDGGKPIPTLKRLELAAGGAWQITPLVQGIERFYVEYGSDVDADSDGAPDNGVPVAYGTAPTTPQGWAMVLALRVNMLVRNTRTTPGQNDTKSYVLGMPGSATAIAVAAANDGYKRHVFGGTIRLINVSGRLEN